MLPGLDFGADARIPRRVTLFEQAGELALGADGRGDLEALAKASMPPMWAWNKSTGSKLSRRTLASKFNPPVVKPPYFKMMSIILVVR